MSKKFCVIWYNNLLYKIIQVFLDKKYLFIYQLKRKKIMIYVFAIIK